MGMTRSSVGDLVSKSKESLLNAKNEMAATGRSAVSAPTNFITTSVKASQGAMKDFEGNVNNLADDVKNNLEAASERMIGRMTESMTSIANSLKSTLAGAKNELLSKMGSMKDSIMDGVKFASDKAMSAFSFVPKFTAKVTTMLMWGFAGLGLIALVAIAVIKREQIATLMGR